ncbi:MAG: ribosomal RNA small subunit methyltransferase A [Promethearchaeota archaeon]|nr:MAG: ribosomal RNA small subunit methyltransferase A [Candidatus Lokiarchaeota archaeon]
MDKKDVQLILRQLNLKPNKNLGQNFVINQNLIREILEFSNISSKDTVLEIGPGLGAITQELVKIAGRVYAIEIDNRLYAYLRDKFSTHENIEIIEGDILNIALPKHEKVVSNIPYSITGPLLEKVFFNENPSQGILTIEKAIADRIFYKGTYKNFSKITVSVNSFLKPIKKHVIPRHYFYPAPKIDLALIKMNPKEFIDDYLLESDNRDFYLKFLGGIMPYKNKNLINALELFLKNSNAVELDKVELHELLDLNNMRNDKVFRYQIEDFINICKLIHHKLKKKASSE